MKKILFSLLISLTTIFAGKTEICQSNCGTNFGKCLITTGDFLTCFKGQSDCSSDCFKGLSVTYANEKVKANVDVCQMSCGIDFGKCLVTTFDAKTCSWQGVSCYRDCLEGVKSHKKQEVEVRSDVGACDRNCAVDFGKCVMTTGDFKSCFLGQANCAFTCLKSV
jgi:hypothetical protein